MSAAVGDEKQRMRKASQEGATDVLVNNRKLSGPLLMRSARSIAWRKRRPKPGGFTFVPVLRLDQLGAQLG